MLIALRNNWLGEEVKGCWSGMPMRTIQSIIEKWNYIDRPTTLAWIMSTGSDCVIHLTCDSIYANAIWLPIGYRQRASSRLIQNEPYFSMGIIFQLGVLISYLCYIEVKSIFCIFKRTWNWINWNCNGGNNRGVKLGRSKSYLFCMIYVWKSFSEEFI